MSNNDTPKTRRAKQRDKTMSEVQSLASTNTTSTTASVQTYPKGTKTTKMVPITRNRQQSLDPNLTKNWSPKTMQRKLDKMTIDKQQEKYKKAVMSVVAVRRSSTLWRLATKHDHEHHEHEDHPPMVHPRLAKFKMMHSRSMSKLQVKGQKW